jgi:hypothetical protein
MRTLILTTLASVALAGAASAQINAPALPDIHPSGSLLWPRDDSYAYLRGHGIDKDEATIITESLAPQGKRATPGFFSTFAPETEATVASQAPVSARVPDFSPTTSWDAWRQHQYDCSVTYPSYNPATDMVMSTDGGREFCQLSLATSGIRF